MSTQILVELHFHNFRNFNTEKKQQLNVDVMVPWVKWIIMSNKMLAFCRFHNTYKTNVYNEGISLKEKKEYKKFKRTIHLERILLLSFKWLKYTFQGKPGLKPEKFNLNTVNFIKYVSYGDSCRTLIDDTRKYLSQATSWMKENVE